MNINDILIGISEKFKNGSEKREYSVTDNDGYSYTLVDIEVSESQIDRLIEELEKEK